MLNASQTILLLFLKLNVLRFFFLVKKFILFFALTTSTELYWASTQIISTIFLHEFNDISTILWHQTSSVCVPKNQNITSNLWTSFIFQWEFSVCLEKIHMWQYPLDTRLFLYQSFVRFLSKVMLCGKYLKIYFFFLFWSRLENNENNFRMILLNSMTNYNGCQR